MDLMDGIKVQGKPFRIPECARTDLAAFFVELGFKVGAEIGVHRGDFTKVLCEVGLKMYAIDP